MKAKRSPATIAGSKLALMTKGAPTAPNAKDTPLRAVSRQEEAATAFGLELLGSSELSYTMVTRLMEVSHSLADGAYWGFVGALLMGLDDQVDVGVWRQLLTANRRGRSAGLMKPKERHMLKLMPGYINVFRAHKPGEADWIMLEPNTMDVLTRNVGRTDIDRVGEYVIHRKDVAAVFTRRGRLEVLCLDVSKLEHVGDIPVFKQEAEDGDSSSADV